MNLGNAVYHHGGGGGRCSGKVSAPEHCHSVTQQYSSLSVCSPTAKELGIVVFKATNRPPKPNTRVTRLFSYSEEQDTLGKEVVQTFGTA